MMRDESIMTKLEKVSALSYFKKIAVFFVLMAMVTVFDPGSGRSAEHGSISLEVRDETLEKTLRQVSKLSGYTIYFQPMWRDLLVTERLVNLTLEQAIVKILDNRISYAIIWDDKEKNVSIFGIELSRQRKAKSGGGKQSKGIRGQGIRFEQLSRTTKY